MATRKTKSGNPSVAKVGKQKRDLQRRGPAPIALEQRFMFDGAAVGEALDAQHHEVAQAVQAAAAQMADERSKLSDVAPIAASREIAFVDERVPDLQSLTGGLRQGVEVIVLRSDSDGIAQILEALQDKSSVDAIYLVGHGS
ncbi:MAG: hypothetical protein RLZZ271_1566, partial [Pseudomonadota bacterium]